VILLRSYDGHRTAAVPHQRTADRAEQQGGDPSVAARADDRQVCRAAGLEEQGPGVDLGDHRLDGEPRGAVGRKLAGTLHHTLGFGAQLVADLLGGHSCGGQPGQVVGRDPALGVDQSEAPVPEGCLLGRPQHRVLAGR
jgi:hypothetical protein